jgi:hypothetical protein
MVAPARMGTEPDPEVPADPEIDPADIDPADSAAPLEFSAPWQEPAAESATDLADREFYDAEFYDREPDELPGQGGIDHELPDHELPGHDLPGRRGVGLLAVIAGVLAIALVAAGVFAVVTHAFKPKTKVAYQVPAVFKLRPGDCFNSGQNDPVGSVLPCSSSHTSEVFATFPLTDSSWPGNATVQARAQAGCTARIAGYMNPELAATSFDQEYVYPDQLAWKAGVRMVICEVRSTYGPITGSVRESTSSPAPSPAATSADA